MLKATKLGQKLPWNYKIYFLALIIWVIGFFPSLISTIYLPYVFKPLGVLLRSLTGKIDFAIGEWVYLILSISLIINIIQFFVRNYSNFINLSFWSVFLIKSLNMVLKLYIYFELIWGLNYQKQTPMVDFKMKLPATYTENQMDSLSLGLIHELNLTRSNLSDSLIENLSFDEILDQTKFEYDTIATIYPFLQYQHPALKKSVFPIWGDFFGYTAFYQPISGEAIIRNDLPVLTLPFTVSHEIAHQLGYASETEANFIAFVIGTESKSLLFNYSMQIQLFTYAQNAHLNFIAKRGDYKLFEKVIARNKQLLNSKVIEDRKRIRAFFTNKQALQIPGSTQLYNQFLLWNKQSKGIESYNEVLLWAIAYKKNSNQ